MAEIQKQGQQAGQGSGETNEADRVMALFREYGQQILIGVGLALAIALGFGAYRNHKQSSEQRASEQLMAARSAQELEQVLSRYSSTAVAPIATLMLASEYYEAGQFDMASQTYRQFEQKYPKHPMLFSAQLGQAHALEAMGLFDQALQSMESFVSAQTNHYLTPVAILGKARVLTQMGRLSEARTVYEDFIAANPDGNWAPMAETALLFVEKELREQDKGISQPPVLAWPQVEQTSIEPVPAPVVEPSAEAGDAPAAE